MIYRCDYKKGCRFKPYMERYYKNGGGNRHWCYICRWHYITDRLYRYFHVSEDVGYCRVDTDREVLEGLREEIFSLQYDITMINKKIRNNKGNGKGCKCEKKFVDKEHNS